LQMKQTKLTVLQIVDCLSLYKKKKEETELKTEEDREASEAMSVPSVRHSAVNNVYVLYFAEIPQHCSVRYDRLHAI
jgi:hypothetical protein